jgi:septal ring factor EnvC (AmiA/AmiB activator)
MKLILILFFIVHSITIAQNEEISSKNGELNELRNSISAIENEITSIRSQTSSSLDVVKKLDRKSHLLNKTIRNLQSQKNIQERQIERINDSLKVLDSSLVALKEDYAKYVKWQFMYGRKSKLELVLSSSSINESLVLMKYFELISAQNENLTNNLESNIRKLDELSNQLEIEKNYKQKVIDENENQVAKLKKNKDEKNKLITQLKESEESLTIELDEKRKAEILIKQIIARLEEEERERERRRRESNLRNSEGKPVPRINYAEFENFNELQGKLNWPVKNGTIVRRFGENKNNRLNTVTLNYGVDIKTQNEEDVKAVAEGVVSAIEWIPGYGSVLIITHRGKFRTVYGHVTDITVYEGDKINGGDVIGKVNSSLEGNILHFEVWNERNYQNPEVWLVRK